MDWNTILTGAISGGLIGGLVNLILPSIKWRYERKKILFDDRRKLIAEVREELSKVNIYNVNVEEIQMVFRRIHKYFGKKEQKLFKDATTNWMINLVQDSVYDNGPEEYHAEIKEDRRRDFAGRYLIELEDILRRIEKKYRLL